MWGKGESTALAHTWECRPGLLVVTCCRPWDSLEGKGLSCSQQGDLDPYRSWIRIRSWTSEWREFGWFCRKIRSEWQQRDGNMLQWRMLRQTVVLSGGHAHHLGLTQYLRVMLFSLGWLRITYIHNDTVYSHSRVMLSRRNNVTNCNWGSRVVYFKRCNYHKLLQQPFCFHRCLWVYLFIYLLLGN